MYVQGVSTRRVEEIARKLCGLEISSSQVSRATKELDEELEAFRNSPIEEIVYLFLDATYLKVRHGGMIRDMACLTAYGIDREGRRRVLGASMSLSEAEVHWREFLSSLLRRGLCGVQLITSDDHLGLEAARKALFSGVSWQRCQFHLSQNAQAYAPKQSMRESIGQAMREIFSSADQESARERVKKVIHQFEKSAPEFCKWLEENIEEGFTVYHFPKAHHRRLRTINGVERANREIKRRTRVAVLFPNKESALRLVSAILAELHDDWITGRKYLDMEAPWPNEEAKEVA